ncbi:MAG TPA: protein kinase [Myxococcaceae bacterium]|nr:protein kinase [Myxococcaceae bacterium]
MPERETAASSSTIGLPHGEMYRGDKIGSYEVLTQLSVGGMAELFLCFTQGAGAFRKFVVVKRILPDVKTNDSYIKMFYDEARITSVLHHPNIAQVLDLGGEGEAAYIAMEFIPGQNLNQISAVCQKRKRLIPLGLSVSVCREICHALHYAHTIKDSAGRESPIIHRDVAQKNVMVTYEGGVKLLDFGIAKARGSLGRTTAGMVKGTTGYMSPEQVRGEALDGRSDVFCMGVVLFELLTGKRLFAAETETEEMERILAAPIPRPDALQRKIPSGLVEVVLKALARNRTDRFASARAMARALDDVAAKWMYDQDKRASFMKGLFAERIDATRRLLDSAGKAEVTEDYKKAAHTLTEDAGAVFPELSVPETDPEYLPDDPMMDVVATTPVQPPPVHARKDSEPAALNGALTPEQAAAAFDADEVIPARKAEQTAQTERTDRVDRVDSADRPGDSGTSEPALSAPARRGGGSTTKWALRIAAVLAVGGVAAVLALSRTPPPNPTIVTQPVVVVVKPPPPEPTPPPPDPKPEAKAGALTLNTTPRCKVMEGREVLGQTPLTEVTLPPGPHSLTLVPDSGPARRLEVKIEPGKTLNLTQRLAPLPKAKR